MPSTQIFLGVDVAGADNTWVAGVAGTRHDRTVVLQPCQMTLSGIVEYAMGNDVAGVAIDAQLSHALSDERGFRSSDQTLRDLLPTECRNWVASLNSLMAVPVRGQMLADALACDVPTILETHPRASLLFGLGDSCRSLVLDYKKGNNREATVASLARQWCEAFSIAESASVAHDGALDALVCATVSLLVARDPNRLRRLRHEAPDRRGRGPFYVIRPAVIG